MYDITYVSVLGTLKVATESSTTGNKFKYQQKK